VQALQDWSPNHLVRVYVQLANMGASDARNPGMAQSFGDWNVLLDDDVAPDEQLLDAYLGATLRHPHAKVFVGLTQLPQPHSMQQHALVGHACGGCGG
jgi:glycosyltransferase involved in cell wall biosynthesis